MPLPTQHAPPRQTHGQVRRGAGRAPRRGPGSALRRHLGEWGLDDQALVLLNNVVLPLNEQTEGCLTQELQTTQVCNLTREAKRPPKEGKVSHPMRGEYAQRRSAHSLGSFPLHCLVSISS